jgi:hypothetical protein
LRAQTATHVREDVNIGAYRDEDDGKAPAVVEAVALTEILTFYPAPVAGNGTVVSFYPSENTYLESVWLAEERDEKRTGVEWYDPYGETNKRFRGGRSVDDEGAKLDCEQRNE